ncbi:YncE family protein [Labilibacter marinus]|uniref:YncE family protein n=1 Tax=Labilibacter marinus TaxID=1477105 RepID=UPI00082B000B|nr:hypothetical protein [Labilibacter marinus]
MKTTYLITLICVAALLSSCASKAKQKKKAEVELKPQLELVWESDSLMTTCESVLYHKESGIIYVSNVNASPWEIDHNGFVSTMDTLGNILELKWMEGMSGPKGSGIVGNKFYVNDINRVVEIDMAAREIVNTYPVEDDPALNDITVSKEGVVYVSGSASGSIYAIQNEKLDTVVTKEFGRLNGLLSKEEGMYYLTSAAGDFGLCNLDDGSTNVLTTELGHGDGIVKLPNGDFITSDWKGRVFYIYAKDWSKTLLLDTREQGINAADIDFIADQNLLLVPTFFHNRVMAYRLVFK